MYPRCGYLKPRVRRKGSVVRTTREQVLSLFFSVLGLLAVVGTFCTAAWVALLGMPPPYALAVFQ